MTATLADELGYYTPEGFDGFDLDAVPTEDRERVAALIPNPAIVGAYVSRDVDGVADLSAFAAALEARTNVLLSGPTGSAKTTAARAFAALHGLPFVSLPINGAMDPGTVWGRFVVDEDRNLVWVDSPASLVLRYGGVLVFDELNMASPRTLAAFHDLLDVRRSATVAEHGGEVIKAHASTLFVATMNPGYEGTARVNQALSRRFDWPILWPYVDEVETVLVPSESLRNFARDVRDLSMVRTDLSTDTMVTFCRTAERLGIRFAAGRLLAGFSDGERGGVRRALELHLPSIANDLGLEAPSADALA